MVVDFVPRDWRIPPLREQGMKYPALVICLAATSLSAGCAPIPVATTYPIRSQQKMQSVAHWQLLAHDTAVALAPKLGLGQRVYIREAPTRSDFDELFETYFVNSLQERQPTDAIILGHDIPKPYALSADSPATNVAGAIYISYGVRRIDHPTSSTRRPPPGLFTLLGTGVWLGHQAESHWSTASAYVAAVPAGLALDLLTGMVANPTHTEVVISLIATGADGKSLFRQDRSYYVDDADAPEYSSSPVRMAYGVPAAVQSPKNAVDVEK
jgi:hypothetical protein